MQNERNKVGIDVYPYTNVSYPIIAPIPSPVIALNTPITAINTPAVVTTKNSPIIATDSNVFIRTPKFYF